MKLYKIVFFLLVFLIIGPSIGFAAESKPNNTLVKEALRLKKMGKKVEDRIEKPLQLGKNVELSFDFDWQSNLLVDTKLKIAKEQREYILEYAELKQDAQGKKYDYQTTGYGAKFQINNLINQQIKVNFGLIYAKNKYNESNKSSRYTIVRFENSAQINNRSKLKLVTDYAIAGANADENFQKVKFNWDWKKELSSDKKFMYKLQTGIAASETPAVYQFKVGGFNGLKLGGQDDQTTGNVFIKNSFEYQKQLFGEHKFKFFTLEKILGSVFMDIAKAATREDFLHQGLQMGAGLGLTTKFKWLEIKAGLAVDEVNSSPEFHLEFKEDF